jgi:hypothetical protein
MTPKEEQGKLEEIRGRSSEQRDEDKRKLRTATVAEIMRRIVELSLQLCRSVGEGWNREHIELVTTQLEKSQDPNELVTALDQEREAKLWTMDHGGTPGEGGTPRVGFENGRDDRRRETGGKSGSSCESKDVEDKEGRNGARKRKKEEDKEGAVRGRTERQ